VSAPSSSGDARDALSSAVAWLQRGGIVAFPTDTFYGLAADPRSPAAVRALFDVKGRDARVAVPLLGASLAQVEACCGRLTGDTAALARGFWPGPLSLILDVPVDIADDVHGGAGTIAVRVPAHLLARDLAAAFGYLVTATSANASGAPPVASADALGELARDPRVHVLDGGPTPGGAPSTIVDARTSPPRLVREGAIAWNRVLESTQR
jgi:L-threonylcarbamoyladenylate synthase